MAPRAPLIRAGRCLCPPGPGAGSDTIAQVSSPSSDRKRLERLLDQRNEHPERLTAIDARIVESFEREHAILVLDMCGFSRLTIKHGIIHYLAMIRRMQRAVLPQVAAGSGQVIKTEADNVFATFRTVPHALKTAHQVHAALARANAVLPEDWDVHVGIGIGFGKLLMIGNDDVYGSEMNLASKLGEDLAEAGDVLLTEAAFARAGAAKRGFEGKHASLGKLRFGYHRAKPRVRSRPR
jgi:adenylate cyclase